MPSTMSDPSSMEMALWCMFYGTGIIGTLVVYGLLQERIMSQPYEGEYFSASVFLVFCNRIAAVVFSLFMIAIKRESDQNAAPLWKYLAISFSSVYASTCQYEALKYVSFPVQMLGKSFKMMPVMVWGMAISGKRYSFNEWLIALAVTGGVTEFLLTGDIASSSAQGSSFKGLALLGLFLVLDGFTSTFQEKLFKEYTTTKYNQMLYVNLGSATVSLLTLLSTRTMGVALAFCGAHPGLLIDASYLSVSAVASQFFIYSQVKEFGALVFAATMNVRQVVSILVSYAEYGHSISPWQIIGLIVVFGALFYKSFMSFLSPKPHHEKTPLVLGQAPSAPMTKAEGKGQAF